MSRVRSKHDTHRRRSRFADFKKVWELRNALEGGSVDIEIYRKVCKSDTDVFAAGLRASMLSGIAQAQPSLIIDDQGYRSVRNRSDGGKGKVYDGT